MSDLIERSKAIQAIYWNVMECNNIEMAESVLKDVPTVDAVKHGHWVDIGNVASRVCSCCHDPALYAVMYNLKGEEFPLKYCPNCGAKMDEVAE